MADMKRHITLQDNTGKRIRVALDNWGSAHVASTDDGAESTTNGTAKRLARLLIV